MESFYSSVCGQISPNFWAAFHIHPFLSVEKVLTYLFVAVAACADMLQLLHDYKDKTCRRKLPVSWRAGIWHFWYLSYILQSRKEMKVNEASGLVVAGCHYTWWRFCLVAVINNFKFNATDVWSSWLSVSTATSLIRRLSFIWFYWFFFRCRIWS